MEGVYVMYEGRNVPKNGFRAYIYGLDDKSKLVNSWDEYLEHVESGIWYPNKECMPESLPNDEDHDLGDEIPKKKRKRRG